MQNQNQNNMSLVGAAAVSGAGSVLGSLISGGMNYRNTKKLMNYQNQMNIENWKMENQYNSPLAQVARIREAGLNPSLVYTGGTDNVGGTVGSSSPASMAGNVDFSQSIPSAVNTYWSAKMNQKQMEMYDAQIDGMKADLNLKHNQAIYQSLQNARESAYLGKYPVLADLAVSMAKSQLEGSDLVNRLRGQQFNINDVNMTKLAVEIDNLRKQGRSIDASVAQRWAEISISKALAQSNIEVNNETKNKLVEDTANAVRQGNILAFERKIKEFEAQVAEGKGVLNKNLTQPRNFFQFADDLSQSIVYYLRKY